MPIEIIRDPQQAPLKPLRRSLIAVIGYGNQGRAHALNMRESGLDVLIGARPGGQGWTQAEDDGFRACPPPIAAADASLVILAVPDEQIVEAWTHSIRDVARPDATIGLMHGYAVCFDGMSVAESQDLVMVAPKGPGPTLRARFVAGQGIPCVLGVEQEGEAGRGRARALAWAAAIGCAKSGILISSMREETETDLFGEQSVLCGGMWALMRQAFEVLVEAGYPQELAYIECVHEMKQVADLVYHRGIEGMMDAISNTAEFGAYEAGPKLIDDQVKQRMKQVLDDVKNGAFARTRQKDAASGDSFLSASRKAVREHPMESAGSAVRALMPWLKEDD